MIGGPHVTVMDEQVFKESQDVDIVVRSEGEETMLELAGLVSEGKLKNLNEVLGITFKRTAKFSATQTAPSCRTSTICLSQPTNILM